MSRIVMAILVCSAMLLLGGRPAMSDEEKGERPTIAVTGTGRVAAAPDLAEIRVGMVTQASTAQEALSSNNEAMTRLHGILKERGVAAKDIQTTQIQVSPVYSQPDPRRPNGAQAEFVPRIAGYRVENTVEVTFDLTSKKAGKLGELLDALVQAGANQIHGISFRVKEPEKLLDEARRRAVADAHRKAEVLAGEAGVVLGAPVKIRDQGHEPSPPRPMMGRAMMAAAAPMPVAPGEQELIVSVAIDYELKQAR
jgi:uncharacterized protein